MWGNLTPPPPRPNGIQLNSRSGHLAPPGVRTDGAFPRRAEPPGGRQGSTQSSHQQRMAESLKVDTTFIVVIPGE